MAPQVAVNRSAIERSSATAAASAAGAAQALGGSGADATGPAAPHSLDATSPAASSAFQLTMAPVLGAIDKRGRGLGDALAVGVTPSAPQGPDAASASTGAAAGSGFAAASSASGSAVVGSPSTPTINTPEFTQALTDHVGYLANNGLNGATMQVNPPQLGPIELRVSVEAGHAQVWMSAHNPATLDALQNSSGTLRDMLSSQGFGQVSVDISQRSFQDGSPYSQARPWSPTHDSGATAATAAVPGTLRSLRTADGLLDAYA